MDKGTQRCLEEEEAFWETVGDDERDEEQDYAALITAVTSQYIGTLDPPLPCCVYPPVRPLETAAFVVVIVPDSGGRILAVFPILKGLMRSPVESQVQWMRLKLARALRTYQLQVKGDSDGPGHDPGPPAVHPGV